VDSTLEPDRNVITEWGLQALNFLVSRQTSRHRRRVPTATSRSEALSYAQPSDDPTDIALLLKVFGEILDTGIDTGQPEHMAYVPSGGLFASAVGEFVARGSNQYTGVSALAPDLVALEHGLLSWLCDQIGWSAPAGGLITTGASLATLAALVAARHHHLGEQIDKGTLYISDHTHHSAAKAAYLAGLPRSAVRIVPSTPDLRMDIAVAEEMITRDRAEGRTPFLIVATAGTTDTGTIDRLSELGQLGARRDVWLHVDAAYGGGFVLTERGRNRLAGLVTADSISIDPHKSLFTSLGTGVLLVRDVTLLQAAHTSTGPYWNNLSTIDELPDFASLGPELTREPRAPRLWFALHVHGIRAFRTTLDEKLDLAAMAYSRLAADPLFEAPWPPDLSTVVARVCGPDDEPTSQLIERINGEHDAILSSTRIAGRVFLRLCILLPATHQDDVARVLRRIQAEARRA
jgi:aromatic-L-amino-acid decarboxylase